MKQENAPLPKNFEARVQDLIYNVDIGLGSLLIKGGLYLFMVLAIMSLYWLSEFWGLKHDVAMDQAQVARQIMADGSFSTKNIRPAAIWLFEQHGADGRALMLRQPDIVHPPVYPWLLSRLYKMMGDAFDPGRQVRAFPPEQWAIVPFGNVCALLTGLVLFLLARRFFEPRIALLAATLYFVSEVVWANSTSGLSVSLAGLWTILAVYSALLTVERRNEAAAGGPVHAWLLPALATALFCGLAFLTRYSAGWVAVLVGVTWAFLIPRNGWKFSLGLLAAVALIASPWVIRNLQVCGQPFGLTPYLALNFNEGGVTHSFERQVTPSFENVGRNLQAKWLTNLADFYETALPAAGNGIVVALFITTFFFRFSRPHVQVLRFGLLAAMIGLLLVAGLFGEETARTFLIFWPLVICYGLSFFYLLLDRMQVTIPIIRAGLMALMIALTALPLIFTLLPPRSGYPYPPYFPSYITIVTPMLNQDELLCTDMPWATAWYGDRSSLLLPVTIEEFYRINDIKKRISGVYFTSLTRDLPYVRSLATGPFNSWYPIFREMIPLDFPLTEAFFIGNRDQLFLTDRPRWPQR
ncbi:MAG TPA: hypothetical protein PKE26_00425 [Kiritimatiellia bacterium]|nr:hypothetical protein [Kiritimatiellia bacterium]HMO97558.1 hypothetical protein [Kiritimatiellia bacterium]HMP95956.1 hypothetical protein [Kiritimatiellia bacterium]